MNDNKIIGGAFLIARKLFDSEIWLTKPSSWKVIWIYILGKVNYADNGRFKRGEGYFNFSQEKRQIGFDISDDTIKKCMGFLRKVHMIDTNRSTRGTIVKVLNYKNYQELHNFRSTPQSTTEARKKHERSTPINNNDNNVNNDNNNHIIEDFFSYYLLKTKKQFKLTPAKRELIAKRLKEGFTLDQLKQAVDNFVIDDWPERHKHLDLIYCIGKQAGKPDNLEKWINYKSKQSKPIYV